MKSLRTLMTAAALGAVAWGCAEPADDELQLDQPGFEEPAPAAEEQPTAAADVALAVESMEGAGEYLTDANGRALYLLVEDAEGSSSCYDDCAEEWPPLIAQQGTPGVQSPEVREDLISTIRRDDGQMQVTYAGHPLYYYHDDEGAGDTAGQDVTDDWGEWYLVRPDGEALEEGNAEDGNATGDDAAESGTTDANTGG